MQSDETLVDLSAIWNVLWAGRWRIVFATLIGLAIAGYLAFVRITPSYSATSVLVLETQLQKIEGIQDIVSDLPLAGPSRELVLFTEREVFRSRFLMNSVVQSLDLMQLSEFKPRQKQPSYLEYIFPKPQIDPPADASVPDVDFAIDQLLKQVRIELVPNSYAYRVTANSASAQLAQDISNAVAQQYIQAQLDNKSKATQQATNWLETRVGQLQRDVSQNEQRVSRFDARLELLSDRDLQTRELKLKELRASARAITGQTSFVSSANLTASDITENFKSPPQDVTDVSVRSDISKGLPKASTKAQNRQERELLSLNLAISELSDDIETQSNGLRELDQMKREAEASKNLYEFFLTRLKETTIQQGIQRPDSRMLSLAVLPKNPSSPNKPLMLMLGVLFGGLIAVVWLFLRHATRRTFLTASELASATSLPIYATIPRGHAQRNTRALNEAVRNLRTRIMVGFLPQSPQVIMFTATFQDEGKSRTAQSLAHQMASLNKRVLFVNADLRRGEYLVGKNADTDFGLADVLMDSVNLDRAIIPNADQGIDMLHSGKLSPNASDILTSPALSKIIAQLRKQYDLIIVDTPPVLLFGDAGIIAQHCDATLYCVRANVTSCDDLNQGLALLSDMKTPATGLILTHYDQRTQAGNRLQRAQDRYANTVAMP